MLIELLVVAAILMYLNARGWLDFNSPHAMGISIGIILVVLFVAWAVWFILARFIVDGLFGFGAWSSSKPLKGTVHDHSTVSEEKFLALKRLVGEVPSDIDTSRIYAEQLLKRGLVDEFILEKRRILKAGALQMQEKCAIYNRLADIAEQRLLYKDALQYLTIITELYPQSIEAANARMRIQKIEAVLATGQDDIDT